MLTFSCFRGMPLLAKERSCQRMLDALELGRQRERAMYDLWAFVTMQEHVHLVLRPAADVRISQILATIKQSVARRAILWCRENSPEFLARLEDIQPSGKRTYRFWQRGGGYDRNLRSVADVHEKIEYVHANPVRRELVAEPKAWPWSSCLAWKTGLNVPLAIDRESVPALGITAECRRRRPAS